MKYERMEKNHQGKHIKTNEKAEKLGEEETSKSTKQPVDKG